MSAIFEIPIASEVLACEEIHQITGSSRKSDQLDWLIKATSICEDDLGGKSCP